MNSWFGFCGRRARNGMVAVWAVVVFLEALNTVGQDSPNLFPSNALPGTAYNVTLVTDSAPDLTDIDSYLRSITSQYATPQEQGIALWRRSRSGEDTPVLH